MSSTSQTDDEWSLWTWSDEYQCEYRCRRTEAGQYEYEYRSFQVSEPLEVEKKGDSEPSGIASAREAELQLPRLRGDKNTDWSEDLDPRYKYHKISAFKYGRVFEVLWRGPIDSDDDSDGVSERGRGREKYGNIVAKILRFVIVDTKENHCICLRIRTYSRRGTTYPCIHASAHAVIYNKPPKIFSTEDPNTLTKSPICFVSDSSRYKLDVASRLNYAKAYAVEYNVKVCFVGKIHSDDERQLRADYKLELDGQRSYAMKRSISDVEPKTAVSGQVRLDSYMPRSGARYKQYDNVRIYGNAGGYGKGKDVRREEDDIEPSQAGYVSGGQPSSQYQASGSGSRDAAPSDYHDHVPQDTYVPRERRSHHRDFDEDDLYNA